MRAQWDAVYLDARTAARRTATVQPTGTGLSLNVSDGKILWWPYTEIRQTQGAYAGEPVRLERGDPAEVLVVQDLGFLSAVHQVAPEAPFHNPATRRRRGLLTVLALLGVCALLGIAYLWGFPALASRLAEQVPLAWEERLGDAVVDQLAPAAMRCTGSAGLQGLGAMLERLKTGAVANPYRFELIVLDSPVVNALAAPGGRIIVFRGLLGMATAPEDLAGVLAHEMAHVLRHHPTRAIIQHASTGLALAALTGDASGAMAYSLEAARTLGMLQYSRQFEEEADGEGARILLAAGIGPAGLIRFLESAQKSDGRGMALPRYLSSHPDTPTRIQRLRALERGKPSSSILGAAAWKNVTRMCPEQSPPGK
jgi:beta-barrel assembly-enhancing protease